ncbi:MAG TPA: Fic family protein [Acidimicrobiales bacterium]|jgi:Fic family protein|nr:Fic family protein [Acidimicrobiales bacterium]
MAAGQGHAPFDPVGVGLHWAPITDLPSDWDVLASRELRALSAVWDEQRETLAAGGGLRHFNERLQRQWSIETGVIERVYTLDRGVTEVLIERGIDASLIPHGATDKNPESVVRIIRDHEEAVEWLFDIVRQQRQVTTSFVKELHALMTRHQPTATGRDQFGRLVEVPLRHGDWKMLPNNPTRADGTVHEYCPPEQVAPEMERLVAMHHGHQSSGVPAEVEAAWLHHRFTQIHPFQDGNGRVARALASLVSIRAGLFPIVVTRDHREKYIDALEAGDAGDLGPLIATFATLQKKALVDALAIAREVTGERQRVDQVIASIGEIFAKQAEDRRADWDRAKELAQLLRVRALDRFSQVSGELTAQVLPSYPAFRAFADDDRSDPERTYWFRFQTREAAKRLEYFANWRDYGSWVRLGLRDGSQADVVLVLTAIGQEYRGLVGATVVFSQREQAGERERSLVNVEAASEELFQVNYKDDEVDVIERFDRWLDRSLVRALEMWRQGLPA